MVYLVILTWNGKEYIKQLFESLVFLSYSREMMKIVVVDSASSDSTQEYLESLKNNNLHLIKLNTNLGFAAGNNIGMQFALAQGAEYIVLLNQDTIVEPDFLSELVKVAASHKNIGIVQPLICYYQNKNEINSWGNELHYLGYGFSGGNHKQKTELKKQKTEIMEITYASAAAVLYKAEMLKKIGLFDENYFAYHEDSDICLRAKLAGYRIVLASQALVYHDYQFPTGKNKERYYWLERNRLYLVLKFYSLKTLIVLSPMFLLMGLGQFVYALKRGYIREFFRAYWWLVANFKNILRERSLIQKNRVIKDKELLRDFTNEIKFQEVANNLLEKFGNPVMKFYWLIIKKII